MKNSTSYKGHPLHPLLVSFPVTFFTATVGFDLASFIWQDYNFRQVAEYMQIAGIITGLAAAVPGIMDFFVTLPPESSAKSRGLQHGLLNTSVIILFTISLSLKQGVTNNVETFEKTSHSVGETILIPILLEIIGFFLLFLAGWMGGTLVYRNQIGVYNRYANSGKWKEEYIKSNDEKIQVATSNELKLDQLKLVHIGSKRIVIGKTEEGYKAFDDRCTHKGGSLAGGVMICGTIQCPWHGSQFNVKTGEVKAGPATDKIKTYSLTEENGKIFLSKTSLINS